MKITFADHHLPVILAALEAYERFKINQPKAALEQVFPKQCFDLGWDKMNELCRPIQKAFFPDCAENSGPSIYSEEAGDARISYEIQKTIEQYLALKKSKGWFGSGREFDGNILNPSGLPPPEIEGLAEMQYMDFLIPEEYQDEVSSFVSAKSYEVLWAFIDKFMLDLPRGEKMEVINKFMDNNGDFRLFHVRVHKPRKMVDISF